MTPKRVAVKNIDEYIAAYPEDVQKILQKIRATIKKAAPKAREGIRYQIPTFTLNQNLIHFAAFKTHIGMYPAPREAQEFKEELSAYDGGKGTVRFPLNEKIPYGLITRIVKYRVMEDLARAERKKKQR